MEHENEDENMKFLKDNIFHQMGNMIKDVAVNFVGQAFDIGANLKDAMINVPGRAFGGKNESQKKKELLSEEILRLEKNREENEEAALKFFSTNIVHIEIIREDGQLEKAFFPILPFCHSLKLVCN